MHRHHLFPSRPWILVDLNFLKQFLILDFLTSKPWTINGGTEKKVLAYILAALSFVTFVDVGIHYYDNTNSHNGKWYHRFVMCDGNHTNYNPPSITRKSSFSLVWSFWNRCFIEKLSYPSRFLVLFLWFWVIWNTIKSFTSRNWIWFMICL